MTINIISMTDEEWTKVPTDKDSGYGTVQTDEGNLPLKKMAIDVKIVGLTATTSVAQSFKNNFTKALEATYIFPLPPGGAVQNLRIKIAGREIIGQLKERGQARAEYAQAISDGHRASIVEEERPDIFTLRAGNIGAGETMEVVFDVVELLPVFDSEVTFRFPLVVAPKYIPGVPLDGENVGEGVSPDTDVVPDGSRISPPTLLPGCTNRVELSIGVSLDAAGFSLSNFKSSLPTSVTTDGNLAQIEILPGERLNRDFILRFDLGKDDIKTQLLLSPDEEGKGGTFALTLVPPAATDSKPRDVVFVLDRSGSMGGWKMIAARRAIGRMVDSLTERDRFSVIAFDTTVEHFLDDDLLIDATNRNRFRAVEWLAKIDSRGGTEMMMPLRVAAASLNEKNKRVFEDRVKSVVLVTDGQVGNEREILKTMTEAIGEVRLHTIGIDEAVSAAFLQGLARLGNGVCELVESEDRLDDAMDRIHRNIGRAALTDIELSFKGMTVDKGSLAERQPDAYEGIATLIMGRFTEQDQAEVKLTGRNANAEKLQLEIQGKVIPSAALGAIWARRQIRKLDEHYSICEWGEDEKKNRLEKELVETSIRFGILSRFTAFVAVDRDAKIESKDLVKVMQPVESPAGWVGGPAPASPMLSSPAPKMSSVDSFGASSAPSRARTHAKSSVRKMKKRPVMDTMEMVASPSPYQLNKGSAAMTRIQRLAAWLFEALSNKVYDFDLGLEQLEGVNLGVWTEVIKRALDDDPSVQYASNLDFLDALNAQRKVAPIFAQVISLQAIFESKEIDKKVGAIYYLAGSPTDHVPDEEFSKDKIWFVGQSLSFVDPGVPPEKSFWKR